MKRDLTAIWCALVVGLLFLLAVHAAEESYSTGLLGAALNPPMSQAEQATIENEAERDVDGAQSND